MGRSWWAKFVLLVVITLFSLAYVYPTLTNLDPSTSKFPFKQKVNLGLDLQGGLYLVLGVDFNKVFRDVVERQGLSLQSRLAEKKITVQSGKLVTEGVPADDARYLIEFDPSQRDAFHELLKKEYWTLRLADEQPGKFQVALSREFRVEVRERTVNQSIEVIRNRIDEFGVAEPSITSQGQDRVVVELPGIKEVDRAKDLIGRTAKLEFKIVDESMNPGQVTALVQQLQTEKGITYKEGTKFSDFVRSVNEAAKGKIPEGSEIAFERNAATPGNESGIRMAYLLKSRAEVTGDDLQDASVAIDQERNRPYVAFQLNPKGASTFGRLTGDNVGKGLAIVLDGIVHSAPIIQSRIEGNGQITLGQGQGDALMKEAKDLAIVLRAGALPAQLDFLEQRAVGPSLGQDSIRNGAMAGVVGCLLVFIFMIFYYRGSGMVAVISLILNAVFSLTILIGLDATLTLPGIAGIALTIGMAVDSNVIIFERIRDELREGKKVAFAIDAGFRKAFAAIFDANITHGIIAMILMTFGTGPVRGFAITLLVGIFTTLFCAVTVCKLFFDGYLGFKKGQIAQLSI